VLNKSNLISSALIAAVITILSSSFSFSSISSTTYTTSQFNSGNLYNVQIDTTNANLGLYCQWDIQNITVPTARDYSSICYDPLASYGVSPGFLIFGGYDGSQALQDTEIISMNYGTFNQPVAQKPSPRFGHTMVSTIPGQEMILFGGADASNNCSSETWKYHVVGLNWELLATTTAPSPRAYFAMAASTSVVVLFGGTDTINYNAETWVYDIIAGTWSLKNVTGPSARKGAAMAYSAADKVFYLYGGQNTGTPYSDFWKYDASKNTWTQVFSSLIQDSGRVDASMFYDTLNSKIAICNGATNSAGTTFSNDLEYYDSGSNLWNSALPLSIPTARKAQSVVFIPDTGKAAMFGGYTGTGWSSDFYYFGYRSSGTFTAPTIDVPFGTAIQWLNVEVSPLPNFVSGTNITYQLSSSTDNATWSSFTGADGSTSTLSSFTDISGSFGVSTITTTIHNNRSYLQYKLYLNSTICPNSPSVKYATVIYNVSPGAPVLVSPLNNASVNPANLTFTWNNSADTSPGTLTYNLQVASDTSFASPIIDTSGIVSGSGNTTSIVPVTSLFNLSQPWYWWRVRAWDTSGSSSTWSTAFSLKVDAVPPSQVTNLSASIGSGNGSINLSWTSPGDDGMIGSITNGSYDIRYTTDAYMIAIPSTVPTYVTASYSSFPGYPFSASVTGLATATTYYLSVRIADPAGNYSPFSTNLAYAMTNASPVVSGLNVTPPPGQTFWTSVSTISWSYYDPNPGDSGVINIYLSADGGNTYNLIIASGLPVSTSYYAWNTSMASSGSSYVIKVEAVDTRGLKGSVLSLVSTIYNPYGVPVVTMTFPVNSDTLIGISSTTWNIYDPNLSDIHVNTVYISSDSGNSFSYMGSTTSTVYWFDTRQYNNGAHYKIKVVSTDSAQPSLTGTAITANNFKIANGNLPPNAFSLLSPADGSSRSVFDFTLQWELNGDPNPGLAVSYTLFYSTASAAFNMYVTSITGITSNAYHLDVSNVLMDTTYYWTVMAQDELGATVFAKNTFRLIILDRFNTVSSDGVVFAQIVSGLPDNAYLQVEEVNNTSYPAIAKASQDAIADRHIEVISANNYLLQIIDKTGKIVSVTDPVINIIQKYSGVDQNGCLSGTAVRQENLKLGYLDENINRWYVSKNSPVLNKSAMTISTQINNIGVLTMLAASSPVSAISSVTNFPNPFAAGSQSTRIRYVLTQNQDVNIKIYTLLGDLVYSHVYSAGMTGAMGQPTGYTNEILWDGRNDVGTLVANGMYLLEIKTDSGSEVRKIGVVK
jgi:hypothetical protein